MSTRHGNPIPRWLVTSALALVVTSCDPEHEITSVIQIDDTPYEQSTTQSLYLTMRDGARIAVDVNLPHPLPAQARIPAIVEMTRYWRSEHGSDPVSPQIAAAIVRGYAYVIIDERGTGASFGSWPHPWSTASLHDFREVVEWVVQQNWSNGRIGAFGSSYPGMWAQLLPVVDHPAVRATVPAFTQYDLYTDIAFPGGIFLDWFVANWRDVCQALDRNELPGQPYRSVRPVDEDETGLLLYEAVAEHAANGDTYEAFNSIGFRDELSSIGIPMDDMSAHVQRNAIEQSNVGIFGWGSWMDHSTAHSAITRFRTLDNPQQVVIGAWKHGGDEHASPYVPPNTPPQPEIAEQWRQALNFLDRYLKEDGDATTEKILYYYTMGAEEWKSTTAWPVEGTTVERWYFDAGQTLSTSVPAGADGRDTYAVDFTASTGENTRWHTALEGPVVYADRGQEDQKLLTFTSEPLDTDMEITGYPVVTLYVSSTHTDGAFYAYLEDVDPSGRVTYVTEGQLRALHRKVSDEAAPYEMLTPYHTFKEADGEPLVPGEVTTVTFGLHPTSVLIRAGHRIRVAIAGHDNGLFARIPADGDPVITVERNGVHASMLELPVVR
jgi:putative CocE/NonD family hydrolase